MCVTNNYMMAPIRCTQNPTMSEEMAAGLASRRVPTKTSNDRVLVVGSGPAGLEAARVLGQRGHEVILAESRSEFGGRVTLESRLPGLAAWSRVRDYRLQQLEKMPNVEMFLESELGAQEVAETGCSLVAVATGSRWLANGVGRHFVQPMPMDLGAEVLTPDDLMTDRELTGHVLIYDDDHFYMGSVLAEKLVAQGCRVTIATPAAHFAGFSHFSLEIGHIHRRMAELGVKIEPQTVVTAVKTDSVELEGIYGTQQRQVAADAVVMVAGQTPNDGLLTDLRAKGGEQRILPLETVRRQRLSRPPSLQVISLDVI